MSVFNILIFLHNQNFNFKSPECEIYLIARNKTVRKAAILKLWKSRSKKINLTLIRRGLSINILCLSKSMNTFEKISIKTEFKYSHSIKHIFTWLLTVSANNHNENDISKSIYINIFTVMPPPGTDFFNYYLVWGWAISQRIY